MTGVPFRVTARTVVEMGRELISSDGIAFYELIKNGLDAGSPTINIIFDLPIHSEQWDQLNSELMMAEREVATKASLDHLKNLATKALDRTVERSAEVSIQISKATSAAELLEAFRYANRILIRDRGHGMAQAELQDVFLTIGTPFRRLEREKALKSDGGHLPLGEKGIGRLSAMRLGSALILKSGRVGEKNWNVLPVDWEDFERRGDEPLEKLLLTPAKGEAKKPAEKGTELDIRGLRRAWTKEQVETVLKEDLRRIADPFTPRAQPVATVQRNAQLLPLSLPNDWLLKLAHATIRAHYVTSPQPELQYFFTYSLGDRTNDAQGVLGLAELVAHNEERIPEGILRRLGPFTVEAYWWNRQRITKIDTIGTVQNIRDAIREWAGGLSIYRDGFRVNPYGRTDSDWLGMDKLAFSSKGYKLNRQQVIGRTTISGRTNPHLLDQTNREGIQETPEFSAFRAILRRLLLTDFKAFLEISEQRPLGDETTAEAIRRLKGSVAAIEVRLRGRVAKLSTERRTWLKRVGLEDDIEEALSLCREHLEKLRLLRDHEKVTRQQLLPAAGMGLMLDVVVHDLNRSTSLAFETAQQVLRVRDPAKRDAFISQLRDELKTLRTRLTVIDQFAPSGRQHRDRFDALRWLNDTVAYWEPRFREKTFSLELSVIPETESEYRIYAVRGMLVQLVGNLLHNSLFWLGVGRGLGSSPSTGARITLNATTDTLEVWDDGPGVSSSDRTKVFQLGFSRKGVGEGKGLGLFIGAEIARYHKTKLRLSDEDPVGEGRLNTFSLDLNPLRER